MKIILVAATVAISFVTFIEASETPVVSVVTNADGKIVKRVNRARLNQLMYQRNGGKIAKPGTKMGTITYVNAQQAAPVKWLEANASVFAQKCKFDIKVSKGEFVLPMPKVIGEASLFVVDDPSLPSILHAPESRWCMVNVAPLKTGSGEKPQFFAARVQKQLTRGFSLLAGAQNSGYPDALTGCITKPEQLDKFADCRLPIDILNRFPSYLKGYGITPEIQTTYFKACQEGWAPAPTNDVQKAIWDKVHAMPTAPIKIKPETKKVKE